MIRAIAILSVLIALTGCSQIEKCVRALVKSSEPYTTQEDRDQTEALARQMCREKASGKGN